MINNRQNGRRRGRGGERAPNAPNRGPNPNQRLDNRARGNAAQLHEKYKSLARDMQMQGDRVTAEYYLQFADHYFRVLSENRARFEEQRPRREWQQNEGYEANEPFEEGDEGEREGRVEAPRVQSERRDEEPRYAAGQANGEQRFHDNENRARQAQHYDRGREERQDREEVSERIEVDRLPPSIPYEAQAFDGPVENGDGRSEDAPRRRGRPRRPRPDDEPVAEY